MKNNKLVLGLAGIAAASAVITVFSVQSHASLYRASELSVAAGEMGEESQEISGATNWWFNLQKDPATGQLNYTEMNSVRASFNATNAAAHSANPAVNPAALSFNEIGPDNVGGRTRAILIDRNNDQHMLAGAVTGGLWESFNGGSSWQKSSFNNASNSVLTVTSICQDPVSNAIYVGTGEISLYNVSGNGAGGFFGGGVWKSTDNGSTWSHLSSTDPTLYNTGQAWTSVNKMACSATGRVFAATNKGLQISDDGGNTWTVPVLLSNGNPNTGNVYDVDVQGTTVVCVYSGKPQISYSNGDVGSFSLFGGGAGTGYPTASIGRAEFAIAPSDENYIYAFVGKSNELLLGVYVSIDHGQTWTVIAAGGNANFEPFGTGQATYDNTCAVDPSDKTRCFFGGVELWKFEMVTNNPPAGQWTRIAAEFTSALSPFYVHSDKHTIVFNPNNANKFYIGCDGGVFMTTNKGLSYTPMNKGYNVTQFYSVADDPYAPAHSIAMGGAQDNGTQFIDGLGNTSLSAISVNGGDGGYCEMSFLNPNAMFSTVYYGSLSRSNNRGNSSSDFYNSRIMNTTNYGQAGFANFVTPIRLWESKDDALSHDSVTFVNSLNSQNVAALSSSTTTYTGTFTPSQPNGTIVLNGLLMVTSTNDTLISDAAGNLTGAVGSGTVTTGGAFSVTFNTAPASGSVLSVHYYLSYATNAVITVGSKIPNQTFAYVTPAPIAAGDTVMIMDPIQSRLAVAFLEGNNPFTGNAVKGGVYITKQPLDFSKTPDWIKIGGAHSLPDAYSGTCQSLCWSADGTMLFVGNDNGRVYRFDNLNMVTDSATCDVDSVTGTNTSTPVRCTLIGAFSGQVVTGVDYEPNGNRLLISLGGYGSTNHVYICNNANTVTTSATTSNFNNRSGNLATSTTPFNLKFPVLSVSFDKYVANRALIGTEYGIWETTNITAASPTWTDVTDYATIGRVPVDMIRQARHEPWYVQNAGIFYYGTHGRGIWRSEESWQMNTGIHNPSAGNGSSSGLLDLNIFPNPASDLANVRFRLAGAASVTMQIFDLNGKLVASQRNQFGSGDNFMQVDVAAYNAGTYIVSLVADGKKIGTGRFIVTH